MRVLLVGPNYLNGSKGGQITHMRTFNDAFSDKKEVILSNFFSSSGLGESQSKIVKSILLIWRVLSFPLSALLNDLVHLNTTVDNNAITRDSLLLFWLRLFRKKYVIQFHGGEFDKVTLNKSKLIYQMWKRGIQQSKCCLVLKPEHQKLITEIGQNNVIPAINYVNVPNNGFNNLLSFEGKVKFVFLGRLIKEKGLYELIESVKNLSQCNSFELKICGDGPEKERLQNLVKEYRLETVIQFCGNVDGKVKNDILRESHCFIIPSYAEGLPYSMLEAMAYGNAVIASNVGLIPKVFEKSICGFLIKPKAQNELEIAMEKVLTDPNVVSSFSEAAYKNVSSNYSYKNLTRFYYSVWGVCEKS